MSESEFPRILFDILFLLGWLIRILGLLVFGVGFGWFVVEVFRKGQQNWQLQIATFLGFVGLTIAMSYFLGDAPASLGAFGIGAGAALLFWGIPKKSAKKG